MAKAKAIAMMVVLAVLLCALAPTYVLAAAPNTPANVSPANATVDISLVPSLQSSPFSDPDAGAAHSASQWQISSVSGDFTSPVFDSGVDETNLTGITLTEGYLTYATTYYWRVRHQDETGAWSAWSAQTSFTTIGAGTAPHQPVNTSPAAGTTEISLTPVLVCSEFSSLNGIGTHAFSQWQIASSATGFAGPLFDSGAAEDLTQMEVGAGLFNYATTYYWRVRHQDSYGQWSLWSQPTAFTTVANRPPYPPANVSPASGATGVSSMVTLMGSEFVDPEGSDSHAASSWQISDGSAVGAGGGLVSTIWSDNITADYLRQITVPGGVLESGTTYYWQVRYYDNHNNASGWSTPTSFTTVVLVAPEAAFAALDDTAEIVALRTELRLQDSSTGADIYSWEWDFGDGATETWNTYTYPRDLVATHTYAEGGDYTVTLTVTNAAGSDDATLAILVLAAPKAQMIALPQAKAGETATFTDVSTGEITSWSWNFGDGTVVVWNADNRPADGKITHKYSDGGSYVVTLSVSGPLGDSTVNKSIQVTGGKGWFELWMAIVAGVLVVAVVALFILRQRMGRKPAAPGEEKK
jgi:hypothetical protein